MEKTPQLRIGFEPVHEVELLEYMKQLAQSPPWTPLEKNPMGHPAKDGFAFFHRDVVGVDPSCILCIQRTKDGLWAVGAFVPDEGQTFPLDSCKAVLRDFDARIAEPAAKKFGGATELDYSEYELRRYFSPAEVALLESYCSSSGSHSSDQEEWVDFLLTVHDSPKQVDCDVFRNCLRTSKWLDEERIQNLAHEYDFAARLLQRYNQSRKTR